jgi:hypothetical protein
MHIEVQHSDKRKVKENFFTLAAKLKIKVLKLRKADKKEQNYKKERL